MLQLYHAGPSVSAIKVRLALHEKKLTWESKLLNVHHGDQFTAAYRKLNPNAVVPTLVHDGRPIIESTVITEYLEDSFPEAALMPAAAHERASARLWMKKVDDYLHAACGALTFAIAFRPRLLERNHEELEARFAKIPDPNLRQRQRESVLLGLGAPQIAPALRNYGKFIGEMEETLAQSPYLAGANYSLADVAATPYVNRAVMLNIDGVVIDNKPRVTAWFERIKARPSFAGAITDWMSEDDRNSFCGAGEESVKQLRVAMRT